MKFKSTTLSVLLLSGALLLLSNCGGGGSSADSSTTTDSTEALDLTAYTWQVNESAVGRATSFVSATYGSFTFSINLTKDEYTFLYALFNPEQGNWMMAGIWGYIPFVSLGRTGRSAMTLTVTPKTYQYPDQASPTAYDDGSYSGTIPADVDETNPTFSLMHSTGTRTMNFTGTKK